jgi:hypothetical protein
MRGLTWSNSGQVLRISTEKIIFSAQSRRRDLGEPDGRTLYVAFLFALAIVHRTAHLLMQRKDCRQATWKQGRLS